jgi:hypothetical protein
MVANFLIFSRDPEVSEGPDPGLGVQIDTVEKRTINVEKHCFDHGSTHFGVAARVKVPSATARANGAIWLRRIDRR